MQLSRLTAGFVDLLFPPRCMGCDKEGSFLCAACADKLPRLFPPFCVRCAEPISAGRVCERCAHAPLAVDGIRTPFLMDGAIRQGVHQLKYQGMRALAAPLAQLLADYWLKERPWTVDALVPTPLHPHRLRERGYNQSALLAKEMGKQVHLPVASGALVRRREAPPQARAASAKERQANVQGAFFCKDPSLAGASVLLIDDVCTTGATLGACAVALKTAGVKKVWALTLAREA